MHTTEIIRRYVDAWNGHDAAVLVGIFTKDGTYCSPHIYPGVSGETLAEFVKGVWTSFPDFSVELLNAGEIEAGVGASHWIARGTNTGPGADGSDQDAKLEPGPMRERSYFDRKATCGIGSFKALKTLGSICPVAGHPCASWNARIARIPSGPITPSIGPW
jgi:hypothetical protein